MSDDGPMHFSELQVTNNYFFVDLLVPRDNQGPGMSGGGGEQQEEKKMKEDRT